MKTLRALAPGKVMLAGEYAVLFGGDSLVCAIDRRAVATFEASKTLEFSGTTHTNHKRYELFTSCLSAAQDSGFQVLPGSYHLDTSAFYNQESKQKMGLGSSAAATVALAKLILAQNRCEDRNRLLDLALLAHKRFSGSSGSGADVAASVYGDIISYNISGLKTQIKPLSLDWWQELIWVDTLRSQNTRAFVPEVLDYMSSRPERVANLVSCSNYLVAQLIACDTKEFAKIFHELFLLMKSIGQDTRIDIISKEHQQIHDCAYSLNGCAKPSGAGGGDLCMAWIPSASREDFIKAMASLGFPVLTLGRASHDQKLGN